MIVWRFTPEFKATWIFELSEGVTNSTDILKSGLFGNFLRNIFSGLIRHILKLNYIKILILIFKKKHTKWWISHVVTIESLFNLSAS